MALIFAVTLEKDSRGSERAGDIQKTLPLPLLTLMCIREAMQHETINMNQEKSSLTTSYVLYDLSLGSSAYFTWPYIVSLQTQTPGGISMPVRK